MNLAWDRDALIQFLDLSRISGGRASITNLKEYQPWTGVRLPWLTQRRIKWIFLFAIEGDFVVNTSGGSEKSWYISGGSSGKSRPFFIFKRFNNAIEGGLLMTRNLFLIRWICSGCICWYLYFFLGIWYRRVSEDSSIMVWPCWT